ncbi:MAG TPA: hypothetical protein VHQ00_16570 [Chloroflexota bacterium]|nr:hypothetical protein [Chloroflexota bacterium]
MRNDPPGPPAALSGPLWFMGLWGANGRDWGYHWPTSDGFLEQSLRLFRTWEPRL